jgi:hypothetical protein
MISIGSGESFNGGPMARTKRERSNGSGTLRDATAGPPATPSTPSATEATASVSANGYVQSAEPKRSRIATAKLAVTLESLGSSEHVVVAAKKG